MSKPIPYDLAGQHFASQSELARTIKDYLRTAPKDTVFLSRLLRDCVNELHPQVKSAGQRSTGQFKFVTWRQQVKEGLPYAEMYRGGPVMMTFFEPLGEWRDVTVYPWRKSIYNSHAELTMALRIKAARMQPLPTLQDRCAAPGCQVRGYRLRYHHVSPTFAEMAEECLGLISEQERETLFGYDKFSPGIYCMADCISKDHPAVLRLQDLHKTNDWRWLCDIHHTEYHRWSA